MAKLERFDLTYGGLESSPDGDYVRFDDVFAMVHELCQVAKGHDGAINSSKNSIFEKYPDEVIHAVFDRDWDIGQSIIEYFKRENDLYGEKEK